MFNSQYYTCEQIDQRLLQGYVDDYNNQNSTNLTKAELLTALYNFLTQGLRTGDIVQSTGDQTNKVMSQKIVTDLLKSLDDDLKSLELKVFDTKGEFDAEVNVSNTTFPILDLLVDQEYEVELYSPTTGGAQITYFAVSVGHGQPFDYVSDIAPGETRITHRVSTRNGRLDFFFSYNEVLQDGILHIKYKLCRDTLESALESKIKALANLLGEGSLYIGILSPNDNPGIHITKVFAYAVQAGTYSNLLDNNGNPLVIPIDGLYVLNYDPVNDYWTYGYLYRSERVFDGGRADTVYGGARSINCGGAAG